MDNASAKIFSSQIYEDDVLLHDYRPARSEQTGQLGLFDNVDKVFYTNKGTGEFIPGPDISMGKEVVHINHSSGKAVKSIYRPSWKHYKSWEDDE